MKNKMLSLSKTIIVGILWFLAFIYLYRLIGLQRWSFDILNGNHWKKILWAWKKGWIIDSLKEWAFILYIFTSVPIFIASWAFMLRPDTYKRMSSLFYLSLKIMLPIHLFPKTFYYIKEKRKKAHLKEEVKEKRKRDLLQDHVPTEILLQRKNEKASAYFKEKIKENKTKEEKPAEKSYSLSHEKEAVSEHHYEATHKTHAVREKEDHSGAKRLDDILDRLQHHQDKAKTEENKKTSKPEKKEKPLQKKSQKRFPDLVNKFKSKRFYVLENVKIEEIVLPILALGKHKIVTAFALDKMTDWVADETTLDGMPAMWTSPHGAEKSPVQKVIEVRRSLKKKFIDIIDNESIESIVCLTKGKISNLDDMKSRWRRESVQVMNAGKDAKTPFLKGIQDYLSESTQPMNKDKIEKIKKILKI
ncbi:MAG: hypothetical protein ACTSXV_01965 [Alphaproteobacteria bacterium]